MGLILIMYVLMCHLAYQVKAAAFV